MTRAPAWLVLCSVATVACAQSEPGNDAPKPVNGEPGAGPANGGRTNGSRSNGNSGNGGPSNGGATNGAPTNGTPANGNGLRFRMPPVVWSGSLMLILSGEKTDGGPTRTDQLISASVGATTFVYAPWLATVSANLGLTASAAQSGEPDSPTTVSGFATGSLMANVFPRSRFPSVWRYEVSDTRIDQSLGGAADYRWTLMSVSQQYQPANGAYRLSATVERRVQEGITFGRDSQDSLLADFASQWNRHQLSANFAGYRNRAQATNEETEFVTLFGRHTYYGDKNLTVDTGASVSRSDDHLRFGDRSVTAAQLASIAVWNSVTQPLTVTGSFRATSYTDSGGGEAHGLSAGVGATYELNQNLRLGGSIVATRIDGSTAVVPTGGLNANYQSEQLRLGPVDWAWFAGASLTGARTERQAFAALSTQLGHTLSRSIEAGGSTWGASLGQNISVAANRRTVQIRNEISAERISRALTQSLGLNWSRPFESSVAQARVTISDARQLDGDQAHFQQANFQLNGIHYLDRYRSWAADLTYQATKQRAQSLVREPTGPLLVDGQQTDVFANGEVAYRHDRLFDVPRLNFNSRLRLSLNTHSDARQLVAVSDRELASWENRLDYRVGKLDTSLSLRVSKADNRHQTFASWRIQRTF